MDREEAMVLEDVDDDDEDDIDQDAAFARAECRQLAKHIRAYALFNIVMNLLEAAVWISGMVYFPFDYEYRWAIFAAGIFLALRIPRAFLTSDFHGTPHLLLLLYELSLWSGRLSVCRLT
jgi:hypothetical protein